MAKTDRPIRVTSFDVAERAGVSQSTVSRALNDDPAITSSTKAKVRSAAEALGYCVDTRASALRRDRTGTLAIVVIGRPGTDPHTINPFHYSLLGSICAAAAGRGYQSLVSFQSEPTDFSDHFVRSRQADGLILIGTRSNDEAWEFHRSGGANAGKVAIWGSTLDDPGSIASDNVTAGRLAAERLLAAGRERLFFVGDIDDPQRQFRERYSGFCDYLRATGHTVTDPVFADGQTRFDQGRASVARLLASKCEFDALFCCCDSLALGVLDGLRSAEVRVPEDVSVIGFDGLESGLHCIPPLTTIQPNFSAAGVMLVDAALGSIEPGDQQRVPVKLIERGSAGPVRK